MSENFEDKTADELREIHRWFDNQGWEDNAEVVAEELSRRGELDSADELSGDTGDDLTHVAHLKR